MSQEHDRASLWEDKWSARKIGFHKTEVNSTLQKYLNKLKGDSKLEKIFVPLCGKSVDMKWLYDLGISVIGIDIVPTALSEFFTESNLEYTQEPVPAMGPNCQLYQSKDGKIKLYCGDIFLYNDSLDGKFDVVWDRASLVALDRKDVPSYVELIKNLLNPEGRILLETVEYDLEHIHEASNGYHPPPHPMFEDEIRGLYEPDCSVTPLEQEDRLLFQLPAKAALYFINKN